MTASRRRWSYSLRTLFVAVTVACIWLGWSVHIVRSRVAMLLEIHDRDGHFFSEMRLLQKVPQPQIPAWRKYLGDEGIAEIRIADDDPRSKADVERFFPEAHVFRYSELYDGAGNPRRTP